MHTTNRASGVELLRIVAMLGIVLSHWGGHGTWSLTSDNAFFVNKVFVQLTQFFGEVGNCIFFLITGYFRYNSTEVNKKGILRLVIDTKFYSLFVWLVVLFLGIYSFSIGGLIKSLLPIVYKQYWFVLPFLVICAIAPWINKILNESSIKTLKWYFSSLIVVEMLLPLIGATTVASNVGLFILVYSIGAMLKKEACFFNFVKKYKYIIVLLGFGVGYFSLIILDLIIQKFNINPSYSQLLIGRFSFLPTITALGLLVLFISFDFYNKAINYLAQSVLSVYLISEHPYVHPWFWKRFFDNIVFYDKWYMFLVAIIQCIIVMLFCMVIDIIYRAIRDKLLKQSPTNRVLN